MSIMLINLINYYLIDHFLIKGTASREHYHVHKHSERETLEEIHSELVISVFMSDK